jgi:hypothetical protein
MTYKIYKLVYEGNIVYVGRTKMTLKQRGYVGYSHNIHLKDIHKNCIMELIEETDDISRERYWINHYKETVLNIQKGDGLDHKEYQKEYWNREDNKQRNRERLKIHQQKKRNKEYENQRNKS